MMNLKKISILIGTLAVLLALYYATETPRKVRQKQEPEKLIPGFDGQKVAAIVVQSPEKGTATLRNEQGVWHVTSPDVRTYRADAAALDKLLEIVTGLKAETVVSKNPKNFDQYEVTAAKGLDVRLADSDNRSLASLYVGKSGPDIFSTYVRVKDSDRVVLVGSILKTVFEKELKDWRDKTIFKLNKDDITEYKVDGTAKLHLKKDAAQAWQVLAPESFAPKKDAADDIMRKLAGLKAVDFAEGPLKDFQLDHPARIITAALKDGTTVALLVGKEKNTYQHFVKPQEAETIFVLEKFNLEGLCPALDKLKPEPAGESKQADNATT